MDVVVPVEPAESPQHMDIEPDEEQSPNPAEKPDDAMCPSMDVEEECIDKGGDSVTPGSAMKGKQMKITAFLALDSSKS